MSFPKGSQRIEWDSIKVVIVPEGEPNPGNPYSEMAKEDRLERIKALYQQIYLRIISKEEGACQ